MMTHLTGMKWHMTVLLICISLIISNAEHLFMYLLVICMPLEKCLFRSSAHFSIGLFAVHWVIWAVYIFWKLSLCWLSSFTNIFSHSVGCLFIFLFVFSDFLCFAKACKFVTPWTVAHQAFLFMEFSMNIGMGSHSFLQGIFLTQGSNLAISCIPGRFFTFWATKGAPQVWLVPIFFLFLLLWETDLGWHCYNLCQRMFCLCALLGVLWCHVL